MGENIIYKKYFAAIESSCKSSSASDKKSWQTPKLVELDYKLTNYDAGSGGDAEAGTS